MNFAIMMMGFLWVTVRLLPMAYHREKNRSNIDMTSVLIHSHHHVVASQAFCPRLGPYMSPLAPKVMTD
jgi:hypothetical protein